MKGKPSAASLRRARLGIEVIKDETKAANGRKGKAAQMGKKSNKPQPKLPPNFNLGRELQIDQVVLAKKESLYAVVKTGVMDLAVKSSPRMLQTLINIADGAGDFSTAPVAVRRLAALDVLNIAGVISPEGQKNGDKPLNELSIDELKEIISATKTRIETRANTVDAVIVGEVHVNDQPEKPIE